MLVGCKGGGKTGGDKLWGLTFKFLNHAVHVATDFLKAWGEHA